jgi:hypothetical protein
VVNPCDEDRPSTTSRCREIRRCSEDILDHTVGHCAVPAPVSDVDRYGSELHDDDPFATFRECQRFDSP